MFQPREGYNQVNQKIYSSHSACILRNGYKRNHTVYSNVFITYQLQINDKGEYDADKALEKLKKFVSNEDDYAKFAEIGKKCASGKYFNS